MRSVFTNRASLMAALTVSMASISCPALSLRTAGSGNNRRPYKPPQNTELQREIVAHNLEVDRRKMEKRDRRLLKEQNK